jgi:hypothetical protein
VHHEFEKPETLLDPSNCHNSPATPESNFKLCKLDESSV